MGTTEQLLDQIQKQGTLILSFRKNLTAHMIMTKYQSLLKQIDEDQPFEEETDPKKLKQAEN